MADYREAFVGIDVAKLKNAIAVAESGRDGEVRYFGEVDASDTSMRRIIQRIAAKFDHVHFCYEAGPTGYGLHRLIQSLGHECMVVAPSLIPRKPGDRVKTNRRDALALARLLRAGELTAVWVPDEGHEAMRDLVRARAAAVETLRVKGHTIDTFWGLSRMPASSSSDQPESTNLKLNGNPPGQYRRCARKIAPVALPDATSIPTRIWMRGF